MPTADISQGETVDLVTSEEAGDMFYVAVESGTIRFGKHERTARSGRPIAEDERAELEASEAGETLHVYGETDATVVYELQGWGLSLFGREIVRVENSPQQSNLSADIAAQSVGNIAADIAGQTLDLLNADTQRISAEGVTEVTADQTATLSGDTSQTTTIRADTGEVWEIKAVRLFAPAISGGSSSDSHAFTMTTEAAGVGLMTGKNFEDVPLEFDDGEWIQAVDTPKRAAFNDIRIDDSNGINVTYDTETTDQPGDREIRIQFDRLVIA